MNQDWQFSLGDNFNSGSELVCVPHCVKLTPAISSGCLNYQGKYTYKKNIYLTKEHEDKKIFLSFEGVGIKDEGDLLWVREYNDCPDN